MTGDYRKTHQKLHEYS